MTLKIRIKPEFLADGLSIGSIYTATRLGNSGCWFKNDRGEQEYMEYSELEQYINGRWLKC